MRISINVTDGVGGKFYLIVGTMAV